MVLNWFQRSPTAFTVTEQSTLREIALRFPFAYDFIEHKFGIRTTPQDAGRSLKNFADLYRLPPPQILFAEIQLEGRNKRVKVLTPKEAEQSFVGKHPVLDVRENWERALAPLPQSQPLTAELMNQILKDWDRNEPILVFCHFGVRSSDAANYLADQGFKTVCLLRGGIDAWSTEVDPSIPRYEGAWC